MATTYVVHEQGRQSEVQVLEDDGQRAVVEVDGERLTLRLSELAGGGLGVDAGGQRRVYRSFTDAAGRHLHSEGVERVFEVQSERDLWLRGAGPSADQDGDRVVASMPGRVVGLQVAVDDLVEAGAVVAVLEAMKMENDVKASAPGRVVELAVAIGDTVETGALLVRLEPTG